jgi:para-nitrobenzyl esterase
MRHFAYETFGDFKMKEIPMKKYLSRSLVLGTLLAATVVATPVLADDDSDRGYGPVVRTAEGPVQGLVKHGVYEFLGIPYAAPPVGKLRWMPPQPVERWRDTRDATKFGNTCAQAEELGVFAGPASINEDCLFLNVFTTRLGRDSWGNDRESKGLPVFVWIHGGGDVDGESNDYDASKLATGGPLGTPTVVVTMNYRLGLFGFFAHPAIDAEGHLFGNYAVLDQQAVLRWVQRNAAAFGGDPTRVLLGGQSAGASNTGDNMLSPLAKGLFNRALYESAPLAAVTDISVYLPRGTAFSNAAASAYGLPDCASSTPSVVAACMRSLTAAQILQLNQNANQTSYNGGTLGQGPMVDGTIIPHNAIYAWTTGEFNHMPTMGGNVQDEQNFSISNTEYFSGGFQGGPIAQVPVDEPHLQTIIKLTYGPTVPECSNVGGTCPPYPASTVPAVAGQYTPGSGVCPASLTPQQCYDLLGTHPGVCRDRVVDAMWAQYKDNPVYEYEFNDQGAPWYYPKMPDTTPSGLMTPLAAHTIDIQFLFRGWHGGALGVQGASQSTGLSSEEERLSDELVAAWTYFAATGNPNPGGKNSPWPQFVDQPGTKCSVQTGTGPVSYECPDMSVPLFLSEKVPALSTFTWASFGAAHNCEFWDTILVYQPPF